jgi:Domain of unknown function (DUF397)
VPMIDSRYLNWRRSTACANGECVEVAYLGDRAIVRNSATPWVWLRTSRSAWQAFVTAVAAPAGSLDDCRRAASDRRKSAGVG